MQSICDALQSGKGKLIGVACEKPLARNVAEARRMVEMVERSGLLHGYLEDQIFAPSVTRGKQISGAGPPHLPAVLTLRVRPKSTVGRIRPGFGKASCKAEECSMT